MKFRDWEIGQCFIAYCDEWWKKTHEDHACRWVRGEQRWNNQFAFWSQQGNVTPLTVADMPKGQCYRVAKNKLVFRGQGIDEKHWRWNQIGWTSTRHPWTSWQKATPCPDPSKEEAVEENCDTCKHSASSGDRLGCFHCRHLKRESKWEGV